MNDQNKNDKIQENFKNQSVDELEVIRMKKMQQKQMLDEQMKLKEIQIKQIPNHTDQQTHSQEIIVNNEVIRTGIRNRTDITKIDDQESQQALAKKLAYQEELRKQMEEKQRQKDEEKERLKREEQQIEREYEIQRQIIEQKENKELIKEGKKIVQDKPKRQINIQQFQTSDQILNKQNEPDYQQINQEIIKENDLQLKQDVQNYKNLLSDQDKFKDYQHRDSFEIVPQQIRDIPQVQMEFQAQYFQKEIPQIQPDHQGPQQVYIHQKLIEDQQKIIEMYKNALGQILDFRQNYMKETQEIQLNFMKERNQIVQAMQPEQLYFHQKSDDIRIQENEINSLQAIQNQLSNLIRQIGQNNSNQNITSIINPKVQQNLNDLIKSQRDKIIRMSQTLSQKDEIFQKQQYPDYFASQNEQVSKINEDNRIQQFDKSLASNSKLIKVPNQFSNKLKEKAQNFEQQRLLNISPNKIQFFTNTQENAFSSENNTIQYENQLKAVNSPNQNQNVQNKGDTIAGLYQTWQLAGESQSSINQRTSVSPNKNKYMQGSLAGSSHLQFINQRQSDLMENGQTDSNSSPYQRQNQNSVAQRPTTNNKIGTIQEIPEREQNLEDDNSICQDNGQVNQSQIEEQIFNQNNDKKIINSNSKIKKWYANNIQQSKLSENDYQDLNNRDEDMTQYSKSAHNRKSKISVLKAQNPQQFISIEGNLNNMENNIHMRSNSYTKPHQQNEKQNIFSPIVANKMINIGQALANQSVIQNQNIRAQIQTNTQKSFYKPPLMNQSNNNLAATGMVAAKQTGSSFYNATMAKTKQQQLIQEQELQKQLMKIFNQNSYDDVNEKTGIKFMDQTEDKGINQSNFQRQNQDESFFENESDINIAQSVQNSVDLKENGEFQIHIIQQQEVNQKFTQQNKNKMIAQQMDIQPKSTKLIDQKQYSWLLQNNIISEQQELEQSRSKDEEIHTQYEHTIGHQSQPHHYTSIGNQLKINDKKNFGNTNFQSQIQSSISEAIWNDAEFQKDDNVYEKQEYSIADKSQIEEIFDNNSEGVQYEGTNTSQQLQFKVIQLDNQKTLIGESNLQSVEYKNKEQLSNSQIKNRIQNDLKTSKPYSVNQPYQFDLEKDSEIPISINYQNEIYDDQLNNSNIKKQNQIIKSQISELNLFKTNLESEPTSAYILKNDLELQKLKILSPDKSVLQTIAIQNQKNYDNNLIEQIYEIKKGDQYNKVKNIDIQQQNNENAYDDLVLNSEYITSAQNKDREIFSNLQTRDVDPILNDTPSQLKVDSRILSNDSYLKPQEFKIQIQNADIQTPSEVELNNNNYQEKSDKVDDFFDMPKDILISKNFYKNQNHKDMDTPSRKNQNQIEVEKCSTNRNHKNMISDAKNQELEDLARLIQQATGNVNNIIENSQQFINSRQNERLAARIKQKQDQQIENYNKNKYDYQKYENIKKNDNLEQSQYINESLIESSQNDNKILSNLDQLIMNLEKQQQDSIKFQNKVSQSKGYVNEDEESKTEQQNENYLQIMNKFRNIENEYEIKPNENQSASKYEYNNKFSQSKYQKIENEDENQEIKVDDKYQMKRQYIRPISGKSALSTSTNRYATNLQNHNTSNIKKNDYQEFDDDEDQNQFDSQF